MAIWSSMLPVTVDAQLSASIVPADAVPPVRNAPPVTMAAIAVTMSALRVVGQTWFFRTSVVLRNFGA
jgi:hypothetical protein